jgi:paraquat-inducible protein B
MSKHASPTVIGAFVVTAFALVVAAVLVLGGSKFFRTTEHVIVYFDGSVGGLKIGSPVKFRGIEIGSVADVRINMTGAVSDPQRIRIPVLLAIDEDRLAAHGVKGTDLANRKEVERLVSLGLRARLATESVVTGARYVALDIKPGTPIVLANDPKYPEIPSVRGAREELPDKANQVLTNLADVDFAKLVDSVQSTVDHADQLVTSPHLARAIARLDDVTKSMDVTLKDISQTLRDLRPAIGELRITAGSANRLLSPGGRVSHQIDSTLHEVQLAARSLRRLTEQLSRDPGGIVRGGKQ